MQYVHRHCQMNPHHYLQKDCGAPKNPPPPWRRHLQLVQVILLGPTLFDSFRSKAPSSKWAKVFNPVEVILVWEGLLSQTSVWFAPCRSCRRNWSIDIDWVKRAVRHGKEPFCRRPQSWEFQHLVNPKYSKAYITYNITITSETSEFLVARRTGLRDCWTDCRNKLLPSRT